MKLTHSVSIQLHVFFSETAQLITIEFGIIDMKLNGPYQLSGNPDLNTTQINFFLKLLQTAHHIYFKQHMKILLFKP